MDDFLWGTADISPPGVADMLCTVPLILEVVDAVFMVLRRSGGVRGAACANGVRGAACANELRVFKKDDSRGP